MEHGIIEFDLSDVDPNCIVSSGILKIQLLDTDTMTIEVYRLTASWDNSTVTWNTEPSNDGFAWATFSTNVSVPVTLEIDINTLIQSWVDLSNSNNGLVMVGVSGIGHVKFTGLNAATFDPELVFSIGP